MVLFMRFMVDRVGVERVPAGARREEKKKSCVAPRERERR
jgi:hypothetical protein